MRLTANAFANEFREFSDALIPSSLSLFFYFLQLNVFYVIQFVPSHSIYCSIRHSDSVIKELAEQPIVCESILKWVAIKNVRFGARRKL